MRAALFRLGLALSLLTLALVHRARLAWRRLTQGPLVRCDFCGDTRRASETMTLRSGQRVCSSHSLTVGMLDGE